MQSEHVLLSSTDSPANSDFQNNRGAPLKPTDDFTSKLPGHRECLQKEIEIWERAGTMQVMIVVSIAVNKTFQSIG